MHTNLYPEPIESDEMPDIEHAIRAATVQVGVLISVIVIAGVMVYLATTWRDAHRIPILSLCTAAAIVAALASRVPPERIARSRWREYFFVGWSVADLILLGTVIMLDGGVDSPLLMLLILPMLFSALSYPTILTALLGLGTISAFVAIVIASDGSLRVGACGALAIASAATMLAFESRNQTQRREQIARALCLRQASERLLAKQATRQAGVAALGQRALLGTGHETLFDEAVAMLSDALSVEIASILELEPDATALSIRATTGMPGTTLDVPIIPTKKGSQAGYLLETGEPVIVADWRTEQRFAQPSLTREMGILSGVAVPIRTNAELSYVLGVQTREQRDFSEPEVTFMLTVANVLGTAIERHRREEQMRYDAMHDALTGLANRTLFVDRLRRALARARRRGTSVAVLFIDLDDFKFINDTLGHEAGDEMIRMIAPRLVESVRVTDTVARFGGDEFTVLIEDVEVAEDAMLVARRIIDDLSAPTELSSRIYHVGASIGVAISSGGEDPEAMMRDADTALYDAKEKTPGRAMLFDGATRARVLERVRTENDLRGALKRGEMDLHFQPVVRLPSGATVGYEALIRWRHPTRGLLSPIHFIPLAERARLVNDIGAWVIGKAAETVAEWQLFPDGRAMTVAVNLSAHQLVDTRLPSVVATALEATAIDPALLRLELTESVLLEQSALVERMLAELRELGVGLVLDDFGTGYSSLGYLKRLPLDAIKLDRSFLEALTPGSTDTAIVSATVTLARALNLEVVAEGIETEEQLEAVQGLGVDFAQGFYFSRPIPSEELLVRLSASTV